jgi:acyl transferase domain-containing protein
VVCTDRGTAIEALRQLRPAPRLGDAAGGVVFMFPGQGSQYEGMSRDLYRELPSFRASIDECARLLAPYLATDLRDLLFGGRPDHPSLTRT